MLKRKMTEENRKKVFDAPSDIAKAPDLFLSDSYSRMLLSVDLPNESKDTTDFINYLSDEVKKVFGDDAYIVGEIVSTYDRIKTKIEEERQKQEIQKSLRNLTIPEARSRHIYRASEFGRGGRTRTYDLRVMSPTSYLLLPPRNG